MKPLFFLDTETTSLEDARLIQLAVKSKEGHCDFTMQFKPPVPISYEAMAVHHITEKMVKKSPPFRASTRTYLQTILGQGIVVAHHAPFDIGVLEREGLKIKEWICTKKAAMRLWPEWESHKLQYLRYRLGIEIEAGEAHDAHADVLVLEAVFQKIFDEATRVSCACSAEAAALTTPETVIEDLIRWSTEPSLLHAFRFGKHRGKTFEQVLREDDGYLAWVIRQPDTDPDVVHTAAHWLNSARNV